ncbi:hypothetical protein ACFLXY_08630 [Chloroflexota bacterium]
MVKKRSEWERLDTHERFFMRNFSHGDAILKFLADSNLQLTRIERDPIDTRSWQLNVKPDKRLMDMFGYNREILIYCSPFSEFQSRVVEAIEGRLRRDPLRLDSDLAILITNDNKISEKILLFRSNRKLTIIPFTLREIVRPRTDPSYILIRRMGQFLFSRNLYDETTPVDGVRFFGREKEVSFCIDELLNGSQIGIFGLRKIGKTSVVREVKERLEANLHDTFPRTSYIDIQLHALTRSCDELLFQIGKDFFADRINNSLINSTELNKFYSQDYSDINKGATIARFSSDISKMSSFMGEVENDRRNRLILMVDEIESLVGTQVHKGFEDGIDFMKMWRGLCQRYNFISTVIVGVNSTMVDLPIFQSVDNPMFKFFKSFYLPNFEYNDAEKMVEILGNKIGISFKPKCFQWLYERLGGHPFLTRQFCAIVAQENPKRPVRISILDLENASSIFLRKHSNVFEQVFEILDLFYPDEATVMEMVCSGELDDPYQVCESPDSIDHLIGCGLLKIESGKASIPIGLLNDWMKANRIGR